MSRKNNENDISPEELLRRLRENMEMEEVPSDFNIEMPDEPEAPADTISDREEIVRLRALNKLEQNDLDLEPADAELIPEVYEYTPDEDAQSEGGGEGDYLLPDDFEIELPEEPDIEAILDAKESEVYESAEGPADAAESGADADIPETTGPAAYVRDTVELGTEAPDAIELEAEIPDTVELEAEIPDAIELEAETPDTVELEAEVPDAIELEAEIPETTELGAAGNAAEAAEPDVTLSEATDDGLETDDSGEPYAEAFARAMNAPVGVERPTTREIPGVKAEDSAASDEPIEPIEPITDEAVDDLMRKYLSEGEYESYAERREAGDDELPFTMEDAEEYVASIESAKQADEPRAPLTETEKAVQQLSGLETDSDLDEVDVNLMIAFGMEEELSEHIGEDNVQTVREAMDMDAEQLDFSRGAKVSTELPDDMEFISQSQIKDVFRVYKRKQRRLIFRFFGALTVAVLIFIFENFSLFGGSFDGTWLDPSVFPTVRSMVSLQLAFFSLAFVPAALFSGMKALFTFKPTARSVLSLMTIGTVIYHIAVCFLYDGTRTVFCTFPLAIAVLMTIISEYLALRRDVYSFRIVSSKRQKYVISEIQNDEESLERAAFTDYIDEENTVSRVAKTSFVDGFFRRTGAPGRSVPALRAILPLAIVISLFFFIFSAFVRRDLYLGLTNAYVAFMLAVPASVLVLFAAPLGRASRIAYEQGGAIIGEDSLDEYSDVAAISFEDKDVFPSGGVRIQSIKVFNNNRIDRVIYNVASLFKYLGGPLADVYSIATKDFECSDDVEIVDIADDGIEAVVSGKRIFLGREDFIVRCGFDPVYEPDDAAFCGKAGCSITYLVANEEVSAKIYTQYSIDPGFVSIAKQLYNAGMFLGIKTFDPGIDSDLLSGFIDLEKYPIKIIKCHSTADRTPAEDKTDSGIVSRKSTRSLLKALALCESVNSTTKTGMFLTMASVLIAFAISAFLTFNDAFKSGYTGIYIGIYQLFWIIPTAIVSRLNIKR